MGHIKPNGGPHVTIQTALLDSSFNSADQKALSKGEMVFVIKHHDMNVTKDEAGKSQTILKCQVGLKGLLKVAAKRKECIPLSGIELEL